MKPIRMGKGLLYHIRHPRIIKLTPTPKRIRKIFSNILKEEKYENRY